MLARQLKYDFELVNNNDFWDWAAGGTYDSDAELDVEAQSWTDMLKEYFGSYID